MKKITAALMIFAMIALSGCGKMEPEEAKAYTQAILDASYKAEFDAYMECTNATKEEAEETYEKNIDLTMETAGFEDAGISEVLQEKYVQIIKSVAKIAKYEVEDATENDEEGFDVLVKIYPFTGFQSLEEELTNAVIKAISKMSEVPNESEINQMTYEMMAEMMEDKLLEPEYGEGVELTIRVLPDEEGVYHIPEEDLQLIDKALFTM